MRNNRDQRSTCCVLHGVLRTVGNVFITPVFQMKSWGSELGKGVGQAVPPRGQDPSTPASPARCRLPGFTPGTIFYGRAHEHPTRWPWGAPEPPHPEDELCLTRFQHQCGRVFGFKWSLANQIISHISLESKQKNVSFQHLCRCFTCLLLSTKICVSLEIWRLEAELKFYFSISFCIWSRRPTSLPTVHRRL